MRTIRGDLIALAQQGVFDTIVHGCNCQNTMGAGVAAAIRTHFPEAAEADRKTHRGDPAKLGTISVAMVRVRGHDLTIVNGYTQFDWRGDRRCKVDYPAVRNVMRAVKRQFAGTRIGYPLIGAGLGGGDWAVIEKIIDEELAGEDHARVVFVPTVKR